MRSFRNELGLAALLAVAQPAWATVEGTLDNRSGELKAWDGSGGVPTFMWIVGPQEWFEPYTVRHTTTDGSRAAHVDHASQWFDGSETPTSTTGFTLSQTLNVTKPSGAGFATATSVNAITLHVSGLGSGSVKYHFFGSLDENGGGGTITLVGPGIDETFNSDATWDEYLELKNGDYTLSVNASANANTSSPATLSVTLAVTLQEHVVPALCGAEGAGACLWPHLSGGCDDADCCDLVCIIDPSCCSSAWDANCVEWAKDNCAVGTASGVVVNPANGHRYQLVTPASWVDWVPFSNSLTSGGTAGCPVTINDANENQWVRDNVASNVPGFAGPTELFISEYYEGTGANNHAIEIYNGTTGSVDLGLTDYKILIYPNGTPVPIDFDLDGVVPAGGTWVVAPLGASAAILDKTDQAMSTVFAFNGNDTVALARGDANTLIDVIGQIGVDPITQWGSGTTSTKDNGIRRKPTIGKGDANGNDFFDPFIEWTGVANGDVSGLGAHIANCDGPFEVWIGLNDQAVEGSFQWSCGGAVNYVNFAPGEPDNGGNQDFVQLRGDTGLWETQGQGIVHFGVTEYAWSDCGSGASCFVSHMSQGCSDDSCCNVICVMDTFCCDSHWDGICVNEANEYCNPGVIAGPVFNPANGHGYYLLDQSAWSEAEVVAQTLGGRLATMNDAAENAWVLTHVAQFDGDTTRIAYVGCNDQLVDGTFRSPDHGAITYTNWAASEPLASGSKNFAELLTDGTWRVGKNIDTTADVYAIVEVACVMDANGSGAVDGADLAMLLGAWGSDDAPLDFTGDGIVDAADLAMLLGAWGLCG